MLSDSDLKFIEVEELRKTKAKLLVRLNATKKLEADDEEYFKICKEVLKDYKNAMEKFNKDIEKTIKYIETIYNENLLGVDNRYLVEMQLDLEYIQTDENEAFEKAEDKTWRMEKKRKDVVYMFNAKYALEKGLSKKSWE